MRQASLGRKSSLNPVRVSAMGDRGSARAEPRKTLKARGNSVGDSSGIPRPRIRSDSSERSSIRPSISRPGSSLVTPVSCQRSSSMTRGRSPSAERASVLGASKGPKKDTRPLADKNYQHQMQTRIENFFNDAGKSSMINPQGSFKQPIALKGFVIASDFLLKLLEIKVELNTTNYLEELPKIAKRLHYPGIVQKSWLQTANTKHSLHNVLAWLSWLVELCEFKDIAAQRFQLHNLPFTNAGEGEAINRSLFNTLLSLYKLWNDGKEDDEKIMEDKYIEEIADQCGFTEEDLRTAQLELDEVKRKHAQMRVEEEAQLEAMSNLTGRLKALEAEEHKQTVYIANSEKYSRALDLEIQQLDADNALMEKEKLKYEREHKQLRETIKHQAMDVTRRDDIVHQCTQIQEYINSFQDHLEEIQKEAWILDMQVTKSRSEFDKAILAFNRDIVIHITGDVAGELMIPETLNAANAETLLETLKDKGEVLNNFKDTIKKELSSYLTSNEALGTKLETLMDRIRILDEEQSEAALKNSETRKAIKKLKKRFKEEEVKLQDSILKLQGDIKQIASELPDIQEVENDVREAHEKLAAVERKKTWCEERAQGFFAKFFEILANHKNELQRICVEHQVNGNTI